MESKLRSRGEPSGSEVEEFEMRQKTEREWFVEED